MTRTYTTTEITETKFSALEEISKSINGFIDNNSDYPSVLLLNKSAKICGLITVDEIINSLENYGKESDELQNMENDFRYWQEVKQELLKIK